MIPRQAVAVGLVPVEVILPIGRAKRWTLVVYNDSVSQELTVFEIRRYMVANGDPTPYQSLTTDLPLNIQTSWELQPETDDLSEEIEVRLTADSNGGVVYLTLVGE